jgi:chemotaxis protein histidine kinase CheA
MRCRLNLLSILLCALCASAQADGARSDSLLEAPVVRSKITDALQTASVDTDQAIIDLRAILERTDDPLLLANTHYNIAVLLQTNEEYELAADSFKLADLASSDPSISRDARSALAGVYYAQSKPTDGQMSIEGIASQIAALFKAADAYRSVLEIAPDDLEAAKNTERVRREIKRLKDLMEQIKEQMDQMQELSDQLREQAQQQQQEAEQTQAAEQSQAQQQQDQQQLSERTEQTQESAPPSSASESLDAAREAQQRAEEALERGDMEEAARQQQQAAEQLQQAAEQIEQQAQQMQGEPQNQSSGQDQQNESEQQNQDGEPGDPELTEDEIDQLARELLDKERREREQRTYRAKGRPIRVEKDW